LTSFRYGLLRTLWPESYVGAFRVSGATAAVVGREVCRWDQPPDRIAEGTSDVQARCGRFGRRFGSAGISAAIRLLIFLAVTTPVVRGPVVPAGLHDAPSYEVLEGARRHWCRCSGWCRWVGRLEMQSLRR